MKVTSVTCLGQGVGGGAWGGETQHTLQTVGFCETVSSVRLDW